MESTCGSVGTSTQAYGRTTWPLDQGASLCHTEYHLVRVRWWSIGRQLKIVDVPVITYLYCELHTILTIIYHIYFYYDEYKYTIIQLYKSISLKSKVYMPCHAMPCPISHVCSGEYRGGNRHGRGTAVFSDGVRYSGG
jgi:hypothetical protein